MNRFFTTFPVLLLFSVFNHWIYAQTDLADDCATGATVNLNINDCSNSDFRVPNANTFSGTTLGACSNVVAPQKDGWARFTSSSGSGGPLVVQFTDDPTVFAAATFNNTYLTCAASEAVPGDYINPNENGAFNIPAGAPVNAVLSAGGVSVTSLTERFLSYVPQAGEKFTISYTNMNEDAAIGIYKGTCPGTLIALVNQTEIGTEQITLTADASGDPYHVRVMNISDETVAMNGTLELERHSSMLMIYSGGCGSLNLLQCSVAGPEGTQKVTFQASPSTAYYARVVDLFGAGDLNGNLCVFNGPDQDGDLCSEAQDVSVGTCDYQYDVLSSFFNDQGLATPACVGAGTVFRDGWVRFFVSPAQVGQKIGVEYQSELKNVALGVYQGDCGNLSEVSCINANNNSEAQKEFLEFTASSMGYYYIRIMNIDDTQSMVGRVCVYTVVAEDICTDALPLLNLGDCNVKANILNSFSPSAPVPVTSTNTANNDIWLAYNHSEVSVSQVRFDYAADSQTDFPEISVYDAGAGFACNPNVVFPIAEIANTGAPANSVSFDVTVGNTYYIRVVNGSAAAVNPNIMSGNVCIYDNSLRAEDNFTTALDFAIDGTDCGRQFNILSTFNSDGNTPILNPTSISCSIGQNSQADAWARFQVGALPGNDLVVEYDNDNNDAGVANDVALLVYRLDVNSILDSDIANDITDDCNDASTLVALNSEISNITIGDGGAGVDYNPADPAVCTAEPIMGDKWLRFTATDNNPITMRVEGNRNVALIVYTGTCGALSQVDCVNDNENGQFENFFEETRFTPTNGVTYHIRLVNLTRFSAFGPPFTNSGPLTAKFSIYNSSSFTEVACANTVDEGVESITLNNGVTGFTANSTYLIRVVNIDPDTDLSTTNGTLCLRDGGVLPEDLCSTARSLVVGDCDINFDLINTDLPDKQPVNASCVNEASVNTDAWITFTATGTQTTFEFFNESEGAGQDIALEAYRGTCGSLFSINCVDNLGPVAGVESMSLNTIVGEIYYVRVMNTGGGNIQGRVCLFNTNERDVCDDGDIVTLTPDACNVRLNVPASFSLSGAQPRTSAPTLPNGIGPCTPNSFGAGARDSWIRFLGDGEVMTIQYENNQITSDPMMFIYTANPGPINCGVGLNGAGNNANEFVCVNDFNTGQQTESVSFQSESGKLYILRLVDLNPGEMTGKLCLFSGSTGPEDCATARSIDIRSTLATGDDVGACNVQFNVLNTNACGDPSSSCGTASSGALFITTGGSDTSVGGDNWVSDNAFISGGNPRNRSNTIDLSNPGTVDESIYQTYRWNSTMDYQIPVVNGTYDIDLHFAEMWSGAFNGTTRQFNIIIEGNTVANNYNIWSAAGNAGYTAVRENYPGIVVTDGVLNIRLVATANNASINGIVVTPQAPPAATPCEGSAWATFTTGLGTDFAGGATLPDDNITVQYDNNNNTFDLAQDAVLEIYRQNAGFTFDCTDPTTYTFVGCSDVFNEINGTIEGIEEVNFGVTQNASETYFIRVISKSSDNTLFGKLCIFYGGTIARPTCAETLDYGPLNGIYQNFDVLENWTDVRPQNQIDSPPCVIPGGANPVIPNPPILSNGWMRFNVPVNVDPNLQIDAVTVQFDNTNFSSTDANSENAALAVYLGPDPATLISDEDNPGTTGPNACTLGNLTLVDCVNNVWRGTESVTIGVNPGDWYYVRVMNVKNDGKNMPGQIRVFEFVSCELQGELVTDGTFENWRALDISSNPTPNTYADMDNWVHENPDIQSYNNHGNDQENIDFYARFATDYGFLRDRSSTGGATQNQQRNLAASKGEFGPEGLYAVSHLSWNYKNNWFCYGHGYTGYGGGNPWSFTPDYCATGGLGEGSEACEAGTNVNGQDFGSLPGSPDRPAMIPFEAEANFMIINGWWKNPSDYPNQEAGKVWCQTLDVSANAGQTRYYVFTAWFNNVKSIEQSGDVPQLRITICDMEDPNSPGTIATVGETALTPSSRLPGTTTIPGAYTQHVPPPPNSSNMRKAAPLGFAFGAAMPCNADGEDNNARLKTLGSDFYLPQNPDQWQVVRCIYRAPEQVTELNLCIENLSLTKNGNDFAIDDISFQQCGTTNTEALDDLLRGDACELADQPTALGDALNMRMLDFSAKLVEERVLLSWLTLNEKNIAYYEVERSTDGNNFFAVGSVDAKGSTEELANYGFTDNNLPMGVDYLYYRLRIVNSQNSSINSSVIRISISSLEGMGLSLIPNPIKSGDNFDLRYRAQGQSAGIVISDMMGNQMFQQSIPSKVGENRVTFSSKNLSPGIYIIRVQVGSDRESVKLVVH